MCMRIPSFSDCYTATMSYLQMRSSWQLKSAKTLYKNCWMSYHCFGRSVSRACTPLNTIGTRSVCRCLQDWKSYTRHKQLWTFLKVHFIVGYLRTWMASTVSSASETSTASRKRCISDSALVSSMPRSHPPHTSDPRLFALTAMRGSFQLQKIPGIYRPGDKQCHCTGGKLIHTSVWEIVGE